MRCGRLNVTKFIRAGATLLVAVVVVAVMSGDALAKHRKHFALHHRAMVAQAVVAPPALGQMRYYGGPKSPMWREVR
jgi:hypothetical protein